MYYSARKSPGLALGLEFFFPGAGSIYANHATGAVITWGSFALGFGLIIWGVGQELDNDEYGEYEDSNDGDTAILLGITAMLGGRIYGLVDSYSSTKRYNRELARRLGFPESLVISPIPMRLQGQTTLGLGMGLQF